MQDQGSLEGPNTAPLEDPDSILLEQISTTRSREDQPGHLSADVTGSTEE